MKKAIVLIAALLSVGVVGYAQQDTVRGVDGIYEMKAPNYKERDRIIMDMPKKSIAQPKSIASQREELALESLMLMLQDANYKEELKIIEAKLQKVTSEQSKALEQAGTALEYIRLVVEPEVSFDVRLALRNIKSAHTFLLRYGGAQNDEKVLMRALDNMQLLHQSLQSLRNLNGAVYEEIEYLLTDPRLPEIERDIFRCIDKKYRECYK